MGLRLSVMRRTAFGPTGVRVPVIGQGTWNMERDDRASCVAGLRRGVDLGLTHIDTAEMYGDGDVEELVGEAIAGRRDDVFLASKVLPQHATYDGTLAACARSLTRLGTDWLDLYLLHWRGTHPLERTIAAFERLVADGKIRAWGVSNFDADDVEEAARLAGPGRVACNQVLYHLGERSIEHAVMPTCARHRIAVVGYSPFGSGRFPSPRSHGGRVLAEIARAHDVGPRAVALAFLVRRPGTFTIPKTANPAHVADNAAAGDLRLSDEELARIDAAFPLGPPPRELPML